MAMNSRATAMAVRRFRASLVFNALPIAIIYAVGMMSANYLPLWTGVMAAHYGMPVSQMGFVATLELGSLAVASLLTAMFFNRISSRWPILAAVLVGIVANLLAGMPPTLGVFALARAIAGGANGFLLAEVNRRAAQSAAPPRVFAGQLFTMATFTVLFFSVAPRLLAYWGPGAPFLWCAAAGLLSLASLPALQATHHKSEINTQDSKAPPVSLAAILMLVASMLAFISVGSIAAYLTPAAAHVGMNISRLSHLLALSALLGLAAPVTAGWMADGRVSPLLALMAGDAMIVLCAFFAAGTQNAVLFEFGAMFLPIFLVFVVPFYLSVLVKLDPSDRCVSASAGLFMISMAVGPSFGGLAIDHAGLAGLAFAATATASAALLSTLCGMWLSGRSRTALQTR